jgi:hypothetical protein
LPNVNYFQVVFTLPEPLSALMLGNRRVTYALLFRAAWEALSGVVREEAGFDPAAWLVLHTWNQRLEHHPHVHALVPGAGPSLTGDQWIASRHRHHRRRDRPYLVDNVLLSRRFRDRFVAGLDQLRRRGELQLEGEWSSLRDDAAFRAWLGNLAERDWVVFVQPPPSLSSRPGQVLKYLARYMTGGPIGDRRLISQDAGQVRFWARSKHKSSGPSRHPYTLSGVEFVRRWSLHVLPKGLVKSRGYGGYSGRRCAKYLRLCRALLGAVGPSNEPPKSARDTAPDEAVDERWSRPTCPHCGIVLVYVEHGERPSWRVLFAGGTRPAGYERLPAGSRRGGRAPPEG